MLLFLLSFVFKKGFKTYYNYGESMEPTLCSHQLLIVNKIWYDLLPAERYDIVIVRTDDEIYCKRILALPNETIEIRDGRILVNDKPLTDDPIESPISWYNHKTGLGNRGINYPKKLLAADECFYIGDNREWSVWGIVSMEDIRGKVMIHK